MLLILLLLMLWLFRKLSFARIVFTTIVLLALSLSSTDQPRHPGQSVTVPTQRQVADGGDPLPPFPPAIPWIRG